MKQHLDLSTPCIEVALKRRPMVPIKMDTSHGFRNYAYARLILLAYLHLPIDSREGCVCHACNNDKCVNPQHLYLGSQADNIQDQIDAGTHYHTGAHRLRAWKCTNGEKTIFKLGIARASAATGVSAASISKSASSGREVKGWEFEQRPLRR